MDLLLEPSLQHKFSEEEIKCIARYKNNGDLLDLRLSGKISQSLMQHIQSWQKAKIKLPNWHQNENVIYPPTLNLEQSSSEATARYKSSIFNGKIFIDLTTGFGVDAYYLSKSFEHGICLERNHELAMVTSHNYKLLSINNVKLGIGIDSMEFLKKSQEFYDLIYVDPARRDAKGGKVFKLSDCEPNVVQHLDLLLQKGKQILIKTSPILDIQTAINELKFVQEIHVVSVDNECKELLFCLNKDNSNPLRINTIQLGKNEQSFTFIWDAEKDIANQYSLPKKYLFEPNASIMKSGGFKSVGNDYNLEKLHANTHLYTSNEDCINFPGRRFEILAITKVEKMELNKLISTQKANLSIRNFPMTTESLKKKLQVEDGGEHYIFATTLVNNDKALIISKKLI